MIKIYRITNHFRTSPGGDWRQGSWGMPEDGYIWGYVLQLEEKYGGLGVSELRRLRQLEEENTKLKQIVADLSLDKQMLQDILKIKL